MMHMDQVQEYIGISTYVVTTGAGVKLGITT